MSAPRRPWRAGALAAASLLAVLATVPLAQPHAAPEARIDRIFAPWAAPDRPGCAVSVIQGGDVLFAKGYGAANLEYDVPITPATVFHVASVSKQFTALAVALLAAEGRVSWDDDIRRHVPELPDFGVPITLRHLAQHTSGMRDQWSLLQMAGWRWGGDVVTQDDVLDLLARQTALHFRPGTEHLYSNSGYTLLAVVVERVSGQSLRAFTRARVFEPLGMTRTTFRDDHTLLIRDRAYAYAADGAGGYRLSIPDFAVAGATSLFTTVEDLARWNRNFRSGEVGGRGVVQQLQEMTALAGGAQVSYAFGLVHGTHRGRRTVGHGGTDAGYRSEFLRFPIEDLAVAVLCNVRSTNPARLARDVADAVLPARRTARRDRRSAAPRNRSAPAGGAAGAAPSRAELAALAGYYRRADTDVPLHLVVRGDDLVLLGGGTGQTLRPAGGLRFRVAGSDATFEPGRAGRGPTLRFGGTGDGGYAHAAPARPAPERLAEYAGAYRSADLGVDYRLHAEGRRLTLRHRKLGEVRLTPTFDDGFYGGGWYWTFDRGSGGDLAGFTMSSSRARKVRFRMLHGAGGGRDAPVEPWPGACSEPAAPVRCTADRR